MEVQWAKEKKLVYNMNAGSVFGYTVHLQRNLALFPTSANDKRRMSL